MSFNYSDLIDYVQVSVAFIQWGHLYKLVVRGRNFCGELNAPIFPSWVVDCKARKFWKCKNNASNA